MSNPFYNYSGNFIPGTLARAETVGVEFAAVQAGFALLAYQGTDSGVANAYVVTTNGAPTGAYTDGQQVNVKLLNANTSTATVNVNGIGAVAIVRSNGTALQAGDIIANTWYNLVYNSTYSAFTLNNPVTQTTVPGTISSAAPTFKVGLTAAAGVSTQAVPIDAKYAIDQSIAPTWTAVHTFSATPVMNAGLTVSGSAITSSAGLTVSAGGATFTAGSVVVGAPTGGGQGTGTINATGLYINGVAVATGTVTSITGTANQIAASASTGAVTLSMPQNVIIPTPSSGVALTVNAATPSGASDRAMTVVGSAAVGGDARLGITTTTNGDAQLHLDTQGAQNWTITNKRSDGSFRISGSQSVGTSDFVTMTSAGNVTLALPSSGSVLIVGTNNSQSNPIASVRSAIGSGTNGNQLEFGHPNSAGYGSNLGFNAGGGNPFLAFNCEAGTTSNTFKTRGVAGVVLNTDVAGALQIGRVTTASADNQTVTNSLIVAADGGLYMASATGNSQGSGTINATGLYVNGNPVYAGIPINVQGVNYTTVLADANKCLAMNTSSKTFTIAANGSVAYPVGTAISFLAEPGVGGTQIAITTDTLTWAATGGTGTRNLAASGMATAYKYDSTHWIISGTGLS